MKTLIHYTAGIVFSLCLMAALLITSVEAVVYWTQAILKRNMQNTTSPKQWT